MPRRRPVNDRTTRQIDTNETRPRLRPPTVQKCLESSITSPLNRRPSERPSFPARPSFIHRELPGLEGNLGNNINGPSLIRVPEWIEDPLGTYYLYFAHHHGRFIRLAYADALKGPWTVHEPGVLPMEDTPISHGRRGDHVASPDVHLDVERERIVMYYHGPNPPGGPRGQGTYVAVSGDGLDFEARDEYLGWFYFRVFQHGGWHYALAKYGNDGGIMYRSRHGLSGFETGPRILPRVRHKALWKHDNMLYVFFSCETRPSTKRMAACSCCIRRRASTRLPSPKSSSKKAAPELDNMEAI